MGAGASLYSLPDPYDFDVLLPALRDPEGTWAKLGNPEGLTKDEWATAADSEGVSVARFFEGQLDRMYAWADRDRDGVISKADFLWFAAKTVRAAEVPRVDLDDVMTNGLASYLGPIEATHNFRKALSAIKRRPACAQVARPGSDGWLPIHTILTLQDPVRGSCCHVATLRSILCRFANSLISSHRAVFPLVPSAGQSQVWGAQRGGKGCSSSGVACHRGAMQGISDGGVKACDGWTGLLMAMGTHRIGLG